MSESLIGLSDGIGVRCSVVSGVMVRVNGWRLWWFCDIIFELCIIVCYFVGFW